MRTPHTTSSAQIFLSVVTHKANQILKKDRNKVKIHFSMTLTGSTMTAKKFQETFGTAHKTIKKKIRKKEKKKQPKTQNPNIFPGCDQVVTLMAQRGRTRRASKLRGFELPLSYKALAPRDAKNKHEEHHSPSQPYK